MWRSILNKVAANCLNSLWPMLVENKLDDEVRIKLQCLKAALYESRRSTIRSWCL